MAPNPLTKEESHRVTTVMTNACQDQINTGFSEASRGAVMTAEEVRSSKS